MTYNKKDLMNNFTIEEIDYVSKLLTQRLYRCGKQIENISVWGGHEEHSKQYYYNERSLLRKLVDKYKFLKDVHLNNKNEK